MTTEVCQINIGPKQRRKRLNFGLATLAVGGTATTFLLFSNLSRWFRLPLFLLFTLSGYGIFQAYEKTWVRLAARGVRDLDSGEETIEDTDVADQLKKQALKVQLEAVGMGVALTALALILTTRQGNK